MAQTRAVAIRRAVPARRRSYSVVRSVTRRRAKTTIPLAVVAGFLPLGLDVGAQLQSGNWKSAGQVMVHNLLGLNLFGGGNNFDSQGFAHGIYPIALGFGAHWAASKLGVNRVIARARIPLLRI